MRLLSKRWIFRWIHILFSIPIVGYIYSPFDQIPNYASSVRFVFLPTLVLSGLWLWKGHLIRRLLGADGHLGNQTSGPQEVNR